MTPPAGGIDAGAFAREQNSMTFPVGPDRHARTLSESASVRKTQSPFAMTLSLIL
jgi:hypothetical protein